MKLLLLPIFALLVGCYEGPKVKQSENTYFGSLALKTVEYEGHTIIVGKSNLEISLLHHPDCPCGKTKD